MVRKYPVLFIIEVDGETHKIICNKFADEFTVYFDDEKVGSFKRKNLRTNFEYIFNVGKHEYCLFFYSAKMLFTNETARLIIDGRYTDKFTDGKYRIERRMNRQYPYMPDKDPFTIIIVIITVMAYIAAIIIYPPYKDMNFIIIDTVRVFGVLCFIISLVGFYKYPIIGISKRVKYPLHTKIFGRIVEIVIKLLPLFSVILLSIAGVVTALQK